MSLYRVHLDLRCLFWGLAPINFSQQQCKNQKERGCIYTLYLSDRQYTVSIRMAWVKSHVRDSPREVTRMVPSRFVLIYYGLHAHMRLRSLWCVWP